MELQQQDGNLIPIELGSSILIGRRLGLPLGSSSPDLSISRHHVSLQILETTDSKADTLDQHEKFLLSFEVVGKNPILVCTKDGKGKRIYRRPEKGVLKAGDNFSLSIKDPNFFVVKRKEGKKGEVESSILDAVARRERRTQERRKETDEKNSNFEGFDGEYEELVCVDMDLQIGSFDVSEIDPVQDFGFLVKGHEFDRYPRHKIRPLKEWSWFLEEPRDVSSEDDEAFGNNLKGKHLKKKKGDDNNDDDWTAESGDVNIMDAKPGSAKRPRYSTRSKDAEKLRINNWDLKKTVAERLSDQQKELDNEDDETLGGFIVSDDGDIEEDKEEVLEETDIEEEEGDDEESDVD